VARPLTRAGSIALAAGALLAAAAGCGGGEPGAPPSSEKNDDRAAALRCLREEKGLDARPVGEDVIVVGDAKTGPRIRFFLTAGEAEAKQFEGGAEGSEQIGSALLFVRQGSEQVLEKVESCLDAL
jgi:hypothetical protein